MIITIIILAWLLVNTWATLIICQADGSQVDGWSELATLVFVAVVSPWVFLLIKIIYKKIKKRG